MYKVNYRNKYQTENYGLGHLWRDNISKNIIIEKVDKISNMQNSEFNFSLLFSKLI